MKNCRMCNSRCEPGNGMFCSLCLPILRKHDRTIRFQRDVRPKSRSISVSKVTIKVVPVKVRRRKPILQEAAWDTIPYGFLEYTW